MAGARFADSVTQFELVRLCHQPTADGLVTIADIRLLNAAGQITGPPPIDVTWTAQELEVLKAKVAEMEIEFAAETGWTKYVLPVKES